MSVQSTLQNAKHEVSRGSGGMPSPTQEIIEKLGVNMHDFGKFYYECIHHLITYSTT